MAQAEPDYNSIGGLISGILADLRTLIREEIALARIEIRDQIARTKSAAISFAIAVAAFVLGGTFLLIAIALGIAALLNWPAWAGFLTVATLLIGGGAAAFMAARKQLTSVHGVPVETVSTLKENSEWIARRLSSVRK